MTSAKHTPGPWFSEIDGLGSNRVGAFGFDTHDGTEILAQVRSYREINYSTAKANARLIASAPDLLEAAELWLKYNDADEEDSVEMMLNYADALKATRAAIAKAKGEA